MSISADYTDGIAIYPNGQTRAGYCKRTALTDVDGALERLGRDWTAYVATQAEANQVLAQRALRRPAHA